MQGGAGIGITKALMVGLAGYALWQVSADSGSDIPPSLRDEHARVLGLGPEISLTIPAWQMRVDARMEQDFGVTSRPSGRVIAVGVSYVAWRKPR